MEAICEGLKVTQDEGMKIESDCFGKLCVTEDKKEGISAFIEKREAKFKDK
jgi:enoyl-CoA hydratase/carnithine racemase